MKAFAQLGCPIHGSGAIPPWRQAHDDGFIGGGSSPAGHVSLELPIQPLRERNKRLEIVTARPFDESLRAHMDGDFPRRDVAHWQRQLNAPFRPSCP
jgi:hypothetical protein